jgi:hypothetical protein
MTLIESEEVVGVVGVVEDLAKVVEQQHFLN